MVIDLWPIFRHKFYRKHKNTEKILIAERKMMSYSHKTIVFLIISLGLLTSLPINAGECRGLYVKDSKSSGMIVKKNNCVDSPHLSAGSVVELAPKGRLWLKSVASDSISTKFQLICQNRSNQLLELEFSDNASPWLSLSKLTGCNDWVNNKLSCNGKKENQLALYCVSPPIQQKTVDDSGTIERTTSLKMRSFGKANAQTPVNQQKVLDTINSELQVCKQLNQTTQTLTIQWTVDLDKKVALDWKGISVDSALSSCTEAVITTYPYPTFSEAKTFNATF